MADFDPFANQGGPAAWDPEHSNDSRKHADELLKKLVDQDRADASQRDLESATDPDHVDRDHADEDPDATFDELDPGGWPELPPDDED